MESKSIMLWCLFINHKNEGAIVKTTSVTYERIRYACINGAHLVYKQIHKINFKDQQHEEN